MSLNKGVYESQIGHFYILIQTCTLEFAFLEL